MDYSQPDVVNITKIKDGFFLGDEATAANLEVIIQFKITHMINAAGSQIINALESIGIKYLTLNWSESPNQNLFDSKDEIANRIVNFIDDSSRTGEGILVHSLRGQNRACVVVLIYFLKKYRWSLTKTMEFLTSKKFDINISKSFMNQLSMFESRLSKLGQGPKSNAWDDKGHPDSEETLLSNTFVNGLLNDGNDVFVKSKPYVFNKKGVKWADNNCNRRDLLCSVSTHKDLLNQKEIKPVLSHKKLRPAKPCLKNTKSSDVKKTTTFEPTRMSDLYNSSVKDVSAINLPRQIISKPSNNERDVTPPSLQNSSNLMSTVNFKSNDYSSMIKKDIQNNSIKQSIVMEPERKAPVSIEKPTTYLDGGDLRSRFGKFTNNSQQRSLSLDQRNRNNNDKDDQSTKIIIRPSIQSIVNNNINNIYIQAPVTNNPHDYMKYANIYENYDSKLDNSRVPVKNSNVFSPASHLLEEYGRKDISSNLGNSININSSNSYNSSTANQSKKPLTKSVENQRMLHNNFLNSTYQPSFPERTSIRPPEYKEPINPNRPASLSSSVNLGKTITPNSTTNLKTPNNMKPPERKFISSLEPKRSFNPSSSTSPNISLVNKNINTGMKEGPIRLQNEYYDKPRIPEEKPDFKSATLNRNEKPSSMLMKPSTPPRNQYGTIKRSNSTKKDDIRERPSTAPAKEDNNKMSSYSSHKRLSTPNKDPESYSNKQSHINIGLSKYRSPSPQVNINKIPSGVSYKIGSKPKWK